ncbi:MAG: glutamate-1-semialdehyde 2,1-aminomutase [Thermodesulfobacteriota bacterium]
MDTSRSQALFARAQELIPGGVNSPVRACRSVGGEPLFIRKAAGCRLWDVDGNEFVDFVGSWGPMILGHAHPAVAAAVQAAMADGTSFGAPCPLEVELAEMIVAAVPSMEQVRCVSSGTEATMSAIRLARGYTGRPMVVKFDGCYHGHADSFLVKAGSGIITLGIPGSPGVPEDIVRNTLSIPYNNVAVLEETLRAKASEIACVIVEPVAGNMGVVPPAPAFLAALRSLTRELGIVLIFDEVITGFRLALGGAQQYYGILPDLTCLGKIIGGGLPVGAYGGRREIMAMVAPTGPVYQAGTLSGNPLAMAAGIATLKELAKPGVYELLEERAAAFAGELARLADRHGLATCLNRVGSMMTGFFSASPVTDFESALTADTARYAAFYREMRQEGVYLAPSQFEAAFIGCAHTPDDLDFALQKTERAFKRLQL